MGERITCGIISNLSSVNWIRFVGDGIDIFGVVIIVIGIAWSTLRFLWQHVEALHFDQYKIRVGRSLLLGLEILVAADIVKTIAVEPCRFRIIDSQRVSRWSAGLCNDPP